MYRSSVLVCGGTGCTSSGSPKIQDNFKAEIAAAGLQDEVEVVQTGCHGLCAVGPIVIVYPDAVYYSHVQPEDVHEIVAEHLLKGRPVERLIYKETTPKAEVKTLNDTAFYKKQHRIALRNCGVINPERIEEYIARDGYQALGKVLTTMTPDEVIETILASGLRGRGGAGFPTGLKWKFAKGYDAPQKYVCCNADEGDPGAFMDRSVLEGDPHVVLEAMAIASRTACGSPSRMERSMNAPGSPSSALQQTYLSSGSALLTAQNFHFWPVGKPAPPRPRRPAFLMISITSSGVCLVRALARAW